MNVLGLDPGWSRFGWAVLRLCHDVEQVLSMGVICTEPLARKRKTLVSSDDRRRGREIARELYGLVSVYRPIAICVESLTVVRGRAASATKTGRAHGVVDMLAERNSIPVMDVSSQLVRKALLGRSRASKDQVAGALKQRYTNPTSLKAFSTFERGLAKGKHEHGYDALGAAVACLSEPSIQMARIMEDRGKPEALREPDVSPVASGVDSKRHR